MSQCRPLPIGQPATGRQGALPCCPVGRAGNLECNCKYLRLYRAASLQPSKRQTLSRALYDVHKKIMTKLIFGMISRDFFNFIVSGRGVCGGLHRETDSFSHPKPFIFTENLSPTGINRATAADRAKFSPAALPTGLSRQLKNLRLVQVCWHLVGWRPIGILSLHQ